MVSGIHGMSPSNFGAQGGGAAQAFQDITSMANRVVDNPSVSEGSALAATVQNIINSYPNDPSIQSLIPTSSLLDKTVSSGNVLPIAMVASSMSEMTYNPNMNTQTPPPMSQLTEIGHTIAAITATSPLNTALVPQLISQINSVVQDYPNNAQAQSFAPVLNCLTDSYNEARSNPSDPRGSDQTMSMILDAI